MNQMIWILIIFAAVVMALLVTPILTVPISEEEIHPDYSANFDRLEVGLRNATVDICFRAGGQWITDENALRWIDLTEEVEV